MGVGCCPVVGHPLDRGIGAVTEGVAATRGGFLGGRVEVGAKL
jgi:hypothetical protein